MKISGRFFDVYVKKPVPPDRGAFYIAVSVKVSKKAVARNKIKRRVREIIRSVGAVRPVFDVRVVAKNAAVRASFAETKTDLTNLLGKI